MERYFDLELESLRRLILAMSGMVEEAISQAVASLEKLSVEEAHWVIENDNRIDRLENEVDEKALELVARYQPMAGDLRLIMMSVEIVTDLERIADLAVDIAQRALELHGQPLIKPLVDIPKLAALAQKMLRESITAFVNLDSELAHAVPPQDEEADFLRDATYKELTDIVKKNGELASRAIPLILVARHLERICDHATNISENVIYLVEGKQIRHTDSKKL